MSSKRSRKKKINCKKTLKCRKLKNVIRRKKVESDFSNNSGSEENSNKNKYSQNRYLDSTESWRFETEKKRVPKLIDFAKMREKYFGYLQNVVTENCAFCQWKPSGSTLENLSLQLEQEALLASLKTEIYIRSISRIIHDIEKCTEKKIIHVDVQKLLPKVRAEINSPGKVRVTPPKSDSKVENTLPYNINILGDLCVDSGESVKCQSLSNAHKNNSTNSNFSEQSYDHVPTVLNTLENNWCDDDKAQRTLNMHNTLQNSQNSCSLIECQSSSGVAIENFSSPDEPIKCDNSKFLQTAAEPEKVNPLVDSLNQLQKSVEQTLNASEKILKEKAEERERAYIAQILNGEDSLDEHTDSFSDNGNDSKENVYEDNFMKRIEKMREIFGFEEPVNNVKRPLIVKKDKVKEANTICKKPTIWRHEKVIQQYKFAILSSEMSSLRQEINKRFFYELFGDDSDEEHETQYKSEEKYRTSCTERISSWVVKYLMPYYNDKRIIGRNIFKKLGHYISDVIVDEIQYPDEWTVKYFVSKFFPTRKKYVSDADIISFELD